MRLVALAALLSIVPISRSQEKEAHPGYSPTLLLASASEQEGKVVIQISQPGPVPPDRQPKVKPSERFATEWVDLRKVTLGEKVHAFGVDGKPLEKKAVLKTLAKPRGVAVFMRSYENDPQTPPAFYRALLREGTTILVVRPEDLYNPKP
jgi:hypothetical protein